MLSLKPFIVKSEIEHSKKMISLSLFEDIQKIKLILLNELPVIDLREVFVVNFLKCKGYEYRSGFMLINDSSVFEIIHILLFDCHYYFICKKFEVVTFDKIFNAIEIQKTSIENDMQYSMRL